MDIKASKKHAASHDPFSIKRKPRKQLDDIEEEDSFSDYLPESELAKKIKSSKKSSASVSINQIANSKFSSKSRKAAVIDLDNAAEEEDLVKSS